MLEIVIHKWLDFIQSTAITSANKEENKYAEMVDNPEGILNLITSAAEAITNFCDVMMIMK